MEVLLESREPSLELLSAFMNLETKRRILIVVVVGNVQR